MGGSGQVLKWETAQDGLGKLARSTASMPTPGKDEVLVEIRAVSLNYRDTEGEITPDVTAEGFP